MYFVSLVFENPTDVFDFGSVLLKFQSKFGYFWLVWLFRCGSVCLVFENLSYWFQFDLILLKFQISSVNFGLKFG